MSHRDHQHDALLSSAGVAPVPQAEPRRLLDMDRYQWTVLFAAWLGWGFDVFDGLLFNYVAPNAVPTLLGLQIGTPEAVAATMRWTGIISSILLVGWAVGGILFGYVADRIGRVKTLLLTMAVYSLGTAACAFAPNMLTLVLFRIVASLGIGGEWAAGAAMVAEVVPEKRRVDAGALLQTASPLGLFLAAFVTYQIQGVYFRDSPEVAWRYVFLFGLAPALVAFLVRMFVKEPERWQRVAEKKARPTIRELFAPGYRAATLNGLFLASIALLTWWSCNAFIPTIMTGLAREAAAGIPGADPALLGEQWKALGTNMFNIGGVIGALLTVPAAKMLGRRMVFRIYFLASAASIMAVFGLPFDPYWKLYMYFPMGVAVFGIFGTFAYYLPELYPTRLRATGAGFTFNFGRVFAAIGPFVVGSIAASGADALATATTLLFYVGFVPLIGFLASPWIIETKDRVLPD